jgi:hypothetical protein
MSAFADIWYVVLDVGAAVTTTARTVGDDVPGVGDGAPGFSCELEHAANNVAAASVAVRHTRFITAHLPRPSSSTAVELKVEQAGCHGINFWRVNV